MAKNKLRKKTWTFILILLLFIFSALAECPDAENPAFCYDAAAPQNFDWENGDYESIDYSQIDFTQVPSAYAWKVDVSKAIAVGRGQEVTQEILEAHLERGTLDSVPLEVLNKDALTLAIKNKFGFTLNKLESGANFEQGVLRASAGSFAVAGKEGWAIEVDFLGMINILSPTLVEEGKISADDTFMITEELDFTTAKGENLKVQLLSFRNGQAYVAAPREGSAVEAKVGDYLISALKNDVDIYFERGKGKEGNYVEITEKNLDGHSTPDGEVRIAPLPGNRLFGMVKREYQRDAQDRPIPGTEKWVADEESILFIKLENGDGLSATSREKNGKTPLFKHTSNSGRLLLLTGRELAVGISSGKLNVIPPHPVDTDKLFYSPNSVAFELISDDSKISQTFRTSSSNRYALLQGEKQLSGNNFGLRVSNSWEENALKTLDDLQVKYPEIQFEIRDYEKINAEIFGLIEKLKTQTDSDPDAGLAIIGAVSEINKNNQNKISRVSANMAQITDEWLEKNTQLASRVKSIQFDGNFNAADLGDDPPGRLLFGEKAFDAPTLLNRPIRNRNPLQIIDHESAHLQDSYVERREKDALERGEISSEQLKRESLDEKYNQVLTSGFVDLADDKEIKEMSKYLEEHRNKLVYVIIVAEGKKTFDDAEEEGYPLSQEEVKFAISDINKFKNAVYRFPAADLKVLFNPDFLMVHNNNREGYGLVRQEVKDLPDVISETEASLESFSEKYPPSAEAHKKFVQLIQNKFLLPPYAFRDYGDGGPGEHRFAEVSSTFTEVDKEDVRRGISQGNTFIRDATQLAYDSSKISREEYEYRMGNYCENNQCGKCLIYALTCTPEAEVVRLEARAE